MTTQADLDRVEWEKPENWTTGSKWFCIYFSHADSRTFVPKRIPSHGWTLNLAKRSGVIWLIGCIVGPVAITLMITTTILILVIPQ